MGVDLGGDGGIYTLQIDRQMDRQIDRQMGNYIGWMRDSPTDRQVAQQINRQIDGCKDIAIIDNSSFCPGQSILPKDIVV